VLLLRLLLVVADRPCWCERQAATVPQRCRHELRAHRIWRCWSPTASPSQQLVHARLELLAQNVLLVCRLWLL